MKISKEKLKQIIKEELALAELDNSTPSDDNSPEAAKSKSEFAKQFLELSKQVRGVSGLDANEMEMIMSHVVSLIKLAAGKSAAPILKQISDISNKKMGNTGDVQ